MTQDIKAAVLEALGRVAPEADLTSIQGGHPLRAQVDIDSIDFLNFVIDLHRVFGVEVPESDYSALATLDSTVTYLQSRVPHSV